MVIGASFGVVWARRSLGRNRLGSSRAPPQPTGKAMKLLVVDDDRLFATLVQRGLHEEGYAVDVAPTGTEGRMLAHVNTYDGIILDVALPDVTGLQIARELRLEGRATPILMLTGNTSREDIVRGLDAGADDYLTKPFDMDILKARVRALVRRTGSSRTETLTFGDVAIDRLVHEVRVNGKRLSLTPKEFTLLEHLLLHADQIVTRTTLLENVWDLHFDPGSNVVDVHMARLRTKLRRAHAKPVVSTVRGVGYRLTLESDAGE
jgi:DNA-binding response OmpR family regulator